MIMTLNQNLYLLTYLLTYLHCTQFFVEFYPVVYLFDDVGIKSIYFLLARRANIVYFMLNCCRCMLF